MQTNKTLTTIFSVLLLLQLLSSSSDGSLTPSLLLLTLPQMGMAIKNNMNSNNSGTGGGGNVIHNDVVVLHFNNDDDATTTTTKAASASVSVAATTTTTTTAAAAATTTTTAAAAAAAVDSSSSSSIAAKKVLQIPLNQKEIGLPVLYLKQSFDNMSSTIVHPKRNWILEYKYTISYVGDNSSAPVVVNILLLAEQMSQVRPRQLEIFADNRHTPIGYNSKLVYLSKVFGVLPETISRIGKISMDDSVDPMYVRREEDSNTNNTSNSRLNKRGNMNIVFPILKPKQSFDITLIPDEMFSQIGEYKINCMMPAILRPIRGFTLHPKQYIVNVFLTTFDKHFQRLNWMPCLSRK